MAEKKAWDIVRSSGMAGTGNWEKFDLPLGLIVNAAQTWRQKVEGVEKPWLCWNMNDAWCLLQQRLIREVGWTPVVGWDPNCGKSVPPLVPGAIAIDFNEGLNLQALWPHVPLEFAFLWCDRLAFWHADLLVPLPKLQEIVARFETLKDGEMTAVLDYGGRRNLLKYRTHRYWELLGCTTRGASRDLFDKGCGWWRQFWAHPNCPSEAERHRRKKYYYDQGVGIMYWKRRYGGKVYPLKLKDLVSGHFSEIGARQYKKGASKAEELEMNFDLKQSAKSMGLEDFL
ncbi:MAG: hypothetical protein AB7E77_02950 [Desulfobulbus sp.]